MNKRLGQQRGVTLIELMIVVMLIGILAALAVPSFSGMMQRQRVEGAVETLTAAMQNAKAEAVKTNNTAGIVFTPSLTTSAQTAWCFGMQLGATACNCSTGANCAPGSIVKSGDFTGVALSASTAFTDLTFNPLRGTAMTGGAVLTNAITVIFGAGTDSLGVKASVLGDIKICRPSSTTMPSYTDSGAC